VTRQEGFDHEKYLVNVRVPFSPATSPDEQVLEAMIQDAGLKAPRLTPSDIDAKIKDVQYYLFPGTTLMVCAMTLTNGFVVTGESASASPENFNLTIGRKIAFEKARDKIWSLEGYLLKQKLYQEIKTV